MMILSQHKVDIVTKTMQVISLPTVLILYFNIFLKPGIDHSWTPSINDSSATKRYKNMIGSGMIGNLLC